jgi:hypothetical protein
MPIIQNNHYWVQKFYTSGPWLDVIRVPRNAEPTMTAFYYSSGKCHNMEQLSHASRWFPSYVKLSISVTKVIHVILWCKINRCLSCTVTGNVFLFLCIFVHAKQTAVLFNLNTKRIKIINRIWTLQNYVSSWYLYQVWSVSKIMTSFS